MNRCVVCLSLLRGVDDSLFFFFNAFSFLRQRVSRCLLDGRRIPVCVAFCVATRDAQRGAGRRDVGWTTSRKGALVEMEQVESEVTRWCLPEGYLSGTPLLGSRGTVDSLSRPAPAR